jgi:hypothetical protein
MVGLACIGSWRFALGSFSQRGEVSGLCGKGVLSIYTSPILGWSHSLRLG